MKRNESNEEKEAGDPRPKRSRVSPSESSTPSSVGSAAKLEPDRLPLEEEDLQEDKTLILEIGPPSNRSYEDRLGPTFIDFGAIEDIIRNLRNNVVTPLRRRLMPVTVGVGPLSGIIIHGPSGCGKTNLAKAIGNETGLPFHMISAAKVISRHSRITMKKIIEEAHRTAPSILFVDDLNVIGSQGSSLHRRRSKMIVRKMIACMDRSIQALHAMNTNPSEDLSENKSGYVLVIGATNRIDSLEPELRRPGYFDRDVQLRIPEEIDRHEILLLLTLIWKRDDTVDLAKIARITRGFVGADLQAVVDEARKLSDKRVISQTQREIPYDQRSKWRFREWPQEFRARFCMSMADFEEAIKTVQPSI